MKIIFRHLKTIVTYYFMPFISEIKSKEVISHHTYLMDYGLIIELYSPTKNNYSFHYKYPNKDLGFIIVASEVHFFFF